MQHIPSLCYINELYIILQCSTANLRSTCIPVLPCRGSPAVAHRGDDYGRSWAVTDALARPSVFLRK